MLYFLVKFLQVSFDEISRNHHLYHPRVYTQIHSPVHLPSGDKRPDSRISPASGRGDEMSFKGNGLVSSSYLELPSQSPSPLGTGSTTPLAPLSDGPAIAEEQRKINSTTG